LLRISIEAVAKAHQTFFIPESIRRLRLSDLPLSGELARVLRRLSVSTFADLAGASLRDFQRVSDMGIATFLEIGRLIERARAGDFTAPSMSLVNLEQDPGCPPLSDASEVNGKPEHIGRARFPLNRVVAAREHGLHGNRRAIRAGISFDRAREGTQLQQQEIIFIPQEARGKPLTVLQISVRLRHILEHKRFRLMGDLHGLTHSEFLTYRNCGKKTVDELRELVRAIQHAHHAPASADQAGLVVQEVPPVVAGAFCVPANLHNLNASDLPLSVRLEGVLQKKGVRCLGQLHGVSIMELKAIRNCGTKTISELTRLIERAAAGEFNAEAEAAWNPGELVRTLDALIADLPDRNQRILVLRLGGKNDEVPTLEEVGAKFRLTRERVRQVVDRSVEQMHKAGSLRLRDYLDHVEGCCRQAVCPLTPALLGQWLGRPPAVRRFDLAFYIRLVAELSPTIPAWPVGQETSSIRKPRSEEIEQALESVLRDGFQSVSLHDAFRKLRAETSVRDVSAIEFLATLQHARRFKVEFPAPDAPVVRLARRLASDVAKAVLQASDSPLTPEEILARAHSLVGADAGGWNPRTLSNTLAEEKGFYLLGPRSYGLRQHFSLPEETWQQVRADFRELLKQQNRPVSTAEVVNFRRFNWAEQTNTCELACIVREDDRLIDLGKFLFALAEWGIEEREYVKDLIPKVLQKVGRPLTGTEILARLQQLRSVSPTSIASSLRKHPEVRDYGFGHYGLKTWGDAVRSSIVTDGALVQRVIRRAVPPLTLERLCEILDVPSTGELADKLWQTCSVLPDVLRIPDERSDTSRLIHRSCRLERALVATARQVNRPLPLYEFQWELNERFGPIFATKTLDELRRGLEQSPMFLRNAADEFILDIHQDQLGLDSAAIRRACAEILSESKEIVGCEDLLERLEADGKSWEELSPDILASLLRDDVTFQEIGRDRFRVKACKR